MDQREKPNTLKLSVYTPGLSRTAQSHASVRAGSGQGITVIKVWISLIQTEGKRETRRKESRTITESTKGSISESGDAPTFRSRYSRSFFSCM